MSHVMKQILVVFVCDLEKQPYFCKKTEYEKVVFIINL